MLEKLELIRERFIEVSKMIVDPEIVTDMKRYVKLNKEYKNLGVIVTEFEKFEEVIANIANNKEIVATEEDPEFKEMASEGIGASKSGNRRKA